MTRYPDWAAAENAACALLLAQGGPLPARPAELLRPYARLMTYEEAAEALGYAPEAFDQADALTFRQGERWLVCYRGEGNPARRNFTLAHELGHILLKHAGGPADEAEADHFASCLLMPEPVRQALRTRPDLTAEDAAALCYMTVAAVQTAMGRRPSAADPGLIAPLAALYAPRLDALKPGGARVWGHRLQNSEKTFKKCLTSPGAL